MASNDMNQAPQTQDQSQTQDQTQTTGHVLTNADITKLAYRTVLLQAGFNYERMQAAGWLLTQLPCLKKIYKDDKEQLAAAMSDNLEFINTSPHIVGFLNGLLIAMEEAHENRSTIKGLKVALFPPIAGVGDAIFWFTLLPILAGICSSMALEGNPTGPVLFFLVYLALFLIRPLWTHLGYNLGTKAVSMLSDASLHISKAATVLGCTVIGGLIASYVHITLLCEVPINDTVTLNIQKDFLDKIFPNLLPFGYVFLLYFLLTKKRANPIVLIVITFVLAIVLSFFGIL
ncbi:PTS galactosamine transporter subunit IID [Fannyhessea vaginae]|nr:PTS galactosamine transporter subunit IID [Fannyhessea vaginae]